MADRNESGGARAAFEADLLADDDELDTAAPPESDDDDAPPADEAADGDDDADDAPARDDNGRFAERDEADDTAATDAAPRADDPAARSQGIPTPDTPASPAPDKPARDPFRYKVDGREYELEGATVDSKGRLIVDKAALPQLQQLVQRGRFHETTWRQQQAESQRQMSVVRSEAQKDIEYARALVQQVERMFSTEEAFADAYANFHQQLPILQATAKQRQIEQRLHTYEQAEQQQLAQQHGSQAVAMLESDVQTTIRTHYADAGFGDADVADLVGELQTIPNAVLVAERDYPEHGLSRGDVVVHEPTLNGVVAMRARARATQKAESEQKLKRVERAAQANAARTGTAARRIPPAVAARNAPTPERTEKSYKSRRDFERDLLRD